MIDRSDPNSSKSSLEIIEIGVNGTDMYNMMAAVMTSIGSRLRHARISVTPRTRRVPHCEGRNSDIE
jgi:hypothetical protein